MKERDGEDACGLDPGSRNRLTRRTAERFVGETLFARLARAVCEAECLPRKELFEAWEVAKRIRRRTRGGRVWDLCAGHGLLAHALMLLDPKIEGAVCVDSRRPESFERVHEAVSRTWPRLAGRVQFRETRLDAAELEITAGDLVVSIHACGGLTDQVIGVAMRGRSRVAVLPCCHALGKLDAGGLEGWMPAALAIDAVRVERLRQAGYRVWTGTIPAEVTSQNRLLLGIPVT